MRPQMRERPHRIPITGKTDNNNENAMKSRSNHDSVPEENTNDTHGFSKLGVLLSYLTTFLKDSIFSDSTTAQVCEDVIKPLTQSLQSSFCEYLLQIPGHQSMVGIAEVFISHAWSYRFADVVVALVEYFFEKPDIIIWLDILSYNQHKSVNRDFYWWSDTFKAAIREIGSTVMVFNPWNDPIPLKRGWCIWELYCTIVSKSNFGIAMNRTVEGHFLEKIKNTPSITIDEMLATINCEKSECFHLEDKNQIHYAIKKEIQGGFLWLNKMIFDKLRQWVVERFEKHLVALQAQLGRHHEDSLSAMKVLYELYYGQGRFKEAEEIIIACFDERKKLFGFHHPFTLTAGIEVGLLYSATGKYVQAESLFLECLNSKELCQKSRSIAMGSLAEVYRILRRFSDAERLQIACVQQQSSFFGPKHPHTLSSTRNLGILYDDAGIYEKAEEILLQCVQDNLSTLGLNHPQTLRAKSDLAVIFQHQSKYGQALPLLVECLDQEIVTLGLGHPQTLMSMSNLGALYATVGKYEKTRPYYEKCLETRRLLLGSDHPDTLVSLSNLGTLFINLELYDQAEALLRESFFKRKVILGKDHPSTIQTKKKLELVYYKLNLLSKLEELQKE